MRTEHWLAATSAGLFALFAGMMTAMYGFMTDVPEDEYFGSFAADSKILQFISIGAAPGGILAGVSFLMSRRTGSVPAGAMIVCGGAFMLAGMAVCYNLLDMIDPAYLTGAVELVPPLFMAISVPVFAFGGMLIMPRRGQSASG